MSDDLVARLREQAKADRMYRGHAEDTQLFTEAADEIEHLRDLVRSGIEEMKSRRDENAALRARVEAAVAHGYKDHHCTDQHPCCIVWRKLRGETPDA